MIVVKFLTLNVNGLRNPAKQNLLRSHIVAENPDFVLLQETHRQETDQWNDFCPGYIPKWTSGSTRSAGCGLLVRKGIKTLKHYQDPEARFSISQVLLGSSPINVCSVYAPDTPKRRPHFFERLLEMLTTFCGNHPLFVGGDLNFVEIPEMDRLGPVIDRSQFTKGKEEFDRVKDMFGLVDRFSLTGDPIQDFTWSNKDGSVQSRLDRFYIPKTNNVLVKAIQNTALGFSDHRSVGLTCEISDAGRGPGYWKMNTEILGEPEYQYRLSHVLEEEIFFRPEEDSLDLWWDGLKERIKRSSIRYSIARSRRFRSRERDLQNTINAHLRNSDNNAASTRSLLEAQNEIAELRGEKARGVKARSGQKLAEIAEIPNAFFYACERVRSNRRNLTELLVDGKIVSEPEQVRAKVTDFYKNLYSETKTDHDDQNFFLDQMQARCPPEQKPDLEAPISPEEIRKVLKEVQKGKSPGRDGIPYEFYCTFQEELCDVMASVFNTCLRRGLLSQSQREAVISLIPKDGDLRLLKYWRPISLMNCDAKILSKILANRLKSVMPDLVDPQQVCGVPGRKIQHHTLLIREMIAYAGRKDRPLYIISLDQEKAFDRVNWEFMFKILLKLGLPDRFVEYVRVLYSDVKSATNVNGTLSDFFEVKQGVRQGCPLSMLLYSLVIEALCVAVDKSIEVTGFFIPNIRKPVKRTNYADDFTLIFNCFRTIRFCLYLLESFERASGSRLNIEKTRGIAVRHPRETPLKVPGFPIKWNRDDTKILGVIFHPDLERSRDLNWIRLLKKIRERSENLTHRNISLKARARILNSMVLSKVWHVGRVFAPTRAMKEEIESVVYGPYIWQDKHPTVSRSVLQLPIARGGINALPMDTQCSALQIHDFMELGNEEQPVWCSLAKYWIIHDIRDLAPEWRQIYDRTPLKHVVGRRPNWHVELLGNLKNVLINLGTHKDLTVKKIRAGLTLSDRLPEAALEGRKKVQEGISFRIDWEYWTEQGYLAGGLPKHEDVHYLLGYNALMTCANMAKWFRWGKGKGKCPRCNSPSETVTHVFLCYGVHEYQKRVLAYLRPILPSGCTFERLLFGVLDHPMAKVWAIEIKGILWRERCRKLYEKKDTDCEHLFFETIIAVVNTLSVRPNKSSFECVFYNPTTNQFLL